MIKNIIFDVGNVLVDFNWDKQFQELGFEGATYEAVAKATVLSDAWNEYDKGEWSDQKILDQFLKNGQGYELQIKKLWDHIETAVHRFSYTMDWIKALKDAGYHLYILSNYSKRTHDRTRNELLFESMMDGVIFSYMVKEIKPYEPIYKLLLEKYNLIASECVFLDDKEENLEVPKALGIHTIHFTSQDDAIKQMKKMDICY